MKVRWIVASLCFATLISAAPFVIAQAVGVAPTAPLPSQIFNAKKVFISNAGGDASADLWSGGPTQPYNDLYAAIKSLGQYEIESAPGDSDLVLQISFIDPITGVSGTKESGCSSSNNPQIKLILLDPKTRIILWTMDEKASTAHLKAGRDKSLEEAINRLVSDLKALTAEPSPLNTAK
jgi:hypothetical protein